ncbi:hypothetical protein GDO81_013577 [Engystomops pustulosus]|uniref:G-protein coupled receptors family 1 profile domain-containing protein n=2 Tax=Engystomops pustulosus TaxID=76066 RepID=A0AAV7B0I7_ENGPU|nr:hypothetical protein GDO81_013577 [Engystomops pustulosus]
MTQAPKPPAVPKTTVLSLGYISILLCIVGLVGNVFIILLFTLKMKKNYCTIYFLNLAVADLLYLLGCGIYASYMMCLLGHLPIPVFNDVIIGYISDILTNVGFDSSTFLLTALSVERCLTVLFPLYNHLQRPRCQTPIVCVLLWALAILTMALESFVCDDRQDHLSSGAQRCVPIIIFTTTLFVLMLLLMVMSCVTLLVEIQKTSESCRPLRLYVVILLSLLSFFIEMVPARTLNLLLYFDVVDFKTHSLSFYFITSLCTAVHCASNPYINIFVGRWRERTSIKESMEKIFHVNN